MERLVFWAFVVGILLLGSWGADMKKKEREQNPTQHSSPFMRCSLLPDHGERMDCMKREGIENMVVDDPSTEPRRR